MYNTVHNSHEKQTRAYICEHDDDKKLYVKVMSSMMSSRTYNIYSNDNVSKYCEVNRWSELTLVN